MRAIFRREALGGVPHGAFGGVVPDEARPRARGANGGDVEDHAGAVGREERGHEGGDAEEDGFDVDGEDAVELVFRHFQGGLLSLSVEFTYEEGYRGLYCGRMSQHC